MTAILLGFFISMAIALTGVGAGTITAPALILWLGVSPATAVGTALTFGAAVKIPAALTYLPLVSLPAPPATFRPDVPAALNQLLLALLARDPNRRPTELARIKEALGRSMTRLAEPILGGTLGGLITTSGLAAEFGVVPALLARNFKQRHGCIIKQFVLGRRIESAKSLLATATLSVQEVGASVGIDDPQYFNKQFRKMAGLSPSRYREENRRWLAQRSMQLAIRDGRWRKTANPGPPV